MNTNAVHNILNFAGLAVAAVSAALMYSGCIETATGQLDCSASFLPPTYAVPIMGVLGAVKLGMNFFRDGLSGMFKPQPPVKK